MLHFIPTLFTCIHVRAPVTIFFCCCCRIYFACKAECLHVAGAIKYIVMGTYTCDCVCMYVYVCVCACVRAHVWFIRLLKFVGMLRGMWRMGL